MRACKSTYDYKQLVANYIEYNLSKDTEYNNGNPPPDYYTCTAKDRYSDTYRLSFNGQYLISYATRVAKFVRTKYNTYLLIDSHKYSVTTSNQLNKLVTALPATVICIYVTDLENSFKHIVDQHMNDIYETYRRCARARNSEPLKAAIATYKTIIHGTLPELHHQTRKAVQRKLATLPNIPNELNKFTRPALKHVLQDRDIL